MRLRQVCIHPWLAQSRDNSIADVSGSDAKEAPVTHASGETATCHTQLPEQRRRGT